MNRLGIPYTVQVNVFLKLKLLSFKFSHFKKYNEQFNLDKIQYYQLYYAALINGNFCIRFDRFNRYFLFFDYILMK